jgi:hypothetical protein
MEKTHFKYMYRPEGGHEEEVFDYKDFGPFCDDQTFSDDLMMEEDQILYASTGGGDQELQ